jgi:hypothetical protein
METLGLILLKELIFMSKKESKFQKDTLDELEERYPGVLALKNDAKYLQGIPDFSLYLKTAEGLKTAFLEFKKSADAEHQPNQDDYITQLNGMGGFARFIYPENKNEVISELDDYFDIHLGEGLISE